MAVGLELEALTVWSTYPDIVCSKRSATLDAEMAEMIRNKIMILATVQL